MYVFHCLCSFVSFYLQNAIKKLSFASYFLFICLCFLLIFCHVLPSLCDLWLCSTKKVRYFRGCPCVRLFSMVCFYLCLCSTKKVRCFCGWLLGLIMLHCFQYLHFPLCLFFVWRLFVYIFIYNLHVWVFFKNKNFLFKKQGSTFVGFLFCFLILLKHIFIFLPYFWKDGCYYFLNLIFSYVYL